MKKVLSLVTSLALATTANASLISGESFVGTLDNDESRYYIQFDVASNNSLVEFTSWGYAGGVNYNGTTISDGGFDSQLFIFDSASNLLEADDDSSNVSSASSGLSWDAYISKTLDMGSYTAVLTQYNSDYAYGDLVTGSWSNSGVQNFVDVNGNQRTSSFAFDIVGENLSSINGVGHNITLAEVPEPTSIALLGLAFAGLVSRRKK